MSAIDKMIDAVVLRCTICDTPRSVGCDCWEKCPCGWSFLRGTACRNPTHGGDGVLEVVASGPSRRKRKGGGLTP